MLHRSNWFPGLGVIIADCLSHTDWFITASHTVGFDWCMERYPFALFMIANDVAHFIRDFTADSLVIKISESSWYNP